MTTTSDPKTGRRALGRGLDALLPAAGVQSPTYGERSVFLCPVERIQPQRGQPRQHFDEQELEELTQSVREHGLIEPLVVRRVSSVGTPHTPGALAADAAVHPGGERRPPSAGDRFELIAGERRWRAAQRAGMKDVLVVVKDVSPKDAFELALVENVQRSDLNPIEIAEAYDRLLREHGYSHDQLAARVGKDRTTVINSVRLLKLPQRIRAMVIARELTEGHARALLGAPTEKAMAEIADKTVRGRLPVRRVEELVRAAKEGKRRNDGAPGPKKSVAIRDLEARLMRHLGTRVEVRDERGKGEIAISYGSLDELDRVLKIIGTQPMDAWPLWANVLLYFGVMFVAMTLALPILATPTLIAVQFAPAWAVALVATVAAMTSAPLDYWWVARAFRLRAVGRLRERRLFRSAEKWASVAPFWTTAAFAGFPVPFLIVRVLVPLSGYPRAKYVAAVALGRFPRIFVIATFGSFFQIPRPILVKIFLVTLAIAVVAAAVRYFRGFQAAPKPDSE